MHALALRRKQYQGQMGARPSHCRPRSHAESGRHLTGHDHVKAAADRVARIGKHPPSHALKAKARWAPPVLRHSAALRQPVNRPMMALHRTAVAWPCSKQSTCTPACEDALTTSPRPRPLPHAPAAGPVEVKEKDGALRIPLQLGHVLRGIPDVQEVSHCKVVLPPSLRVWLVLQLITLALCAMLALGALRSSGYHRCQRGAAQRSGPSGLRAEGRHAQGSPIPHSALQAVWLKHHEDFTKRWLVAGVVVLGLWAWSRLR